MSEKCKRSIKTTIRNHRQWLSKSASGEMKQRWLDFIIDDLAENTFGAFDTISTSLGGLATYFGTQGMIAVLDEDPDGWYDIHKAVTYRFWALKLRANAFSNTAFLRAVKRVLNLTNYTSNAACLWCYGIVTNHSEIQKTTSEILTGMATVANAVDSAYWTQRVFEPFVLRLNAMISGDPAPESVMKMNLGVYSGVLENWNSLDSTGDPILSLCDYHCANMIDKGGIWDPEFKNTPFDLLPLDILAVYEVRRHLGLSTLKVDHPLLELPLSVMAETNIKPDSLIHAISTAYTQFFGVP